MKTEEKNVALVSTVGVICLFALAPFTALWKAFVAAKIWEMFLSEQIGLKLDTMAFFGVFAILALSESYKKSEKDVSLAEPIVHSILCPALAWLFSYIVWKIIH